MYTLQAGTQHRVSCAEVGPSIGASGPPYSRTGNERVESEALVAHSLRAEGFDASEDGTGRGTPLAVAFHNRQDPISESELSLPIQAKDNGNGVLRGMAVRRLTPRECERLQGFPDDWTKIPYRGKPASKCPDGPRYRALGNSMAVNVMRWIGERIQMVEEIP